MVARRRMDAEQLRTWRDYVETAEALASRLSSRLQSESGSSPGDCKVLLALREADGRRLRSSRLAEVVGWERSRLSHHLGRMERRGLVRRQASAEDPRGAEVVLTEDGADAFRRSSVPHLQAVEELFLAAYSPAELADVQRLTLVLRRHLGLDVAE